MRFNPCNRVAAMLLPAALLLAQVKPSKSVAGTVTGFKIDAHTGAILVRPDNADVSTIPFSAETEVVRVAPGAHDLTKAEPARITDIVTGDRVLVSFVRGMTEARRIVLVTATDIAKRNEAARMEWQTHGVAGIVASTDGNKIMLRAGQQTVTVSTDEHTTIRRYAPDSVRFRDAVFSSVSQIAPGDQLQARGDKSRDEPAVYQRGEDSNKDGLAVKAQEVVFGTFLTKAGTITAVEPQANRVTIRELDRNQPLTIKLTTDSRVRMVPDIHTMMSRMHGGGRDGDMPPEAGPRGMAQAIDRAPAAKIEDLKPGMTVAVTSTKGAANNEITAIVLLANADFIVQMIQAAAHGGQAPNGMPMEEVLRRHGVAPGGSFTLPAIIP
jgi:hypothetical protein